MNSEKKSKIEELCGIIDIIKGMNFVAFYKHTKFIPIFVGK